MPNRYSHAFVLHDYERRGVIDSVYEKETFRYHQASHTPTSHSSRFTTTSRRASTTYPNRSAATSIPTPSPSKAFPPHTGSSVLNQTSHARHNSPPRTPIHPTKMSPSACTPSSVVTQIYMPHSQPSYFEECSSQSAQTKVARSISPMADIDGPLSPLPTTLDSFDLHSSPGSEKTTPRTSLEDFTLGDKLVNAIPSLALGSPKGYSHARLETLDGEADDAVPPPIPRHKRQVSLPRTPPSTSNPPRQLVSSPRPGSRQSVSFKEQAWTPPASAKNVTTPNISPRKATSQAVTAQRSSPLETSPHLTKKNHKLKKRDDPNSKKPPSPATLQRTRTDLNAEEMQRWKKEVQQAKWRRGSWVGAIVGMSFGGRKGSRD